MKKITVTYTAGGKILTAEDNSAYFDQENVSLQIDAKIETDKNVRAYIKAANGNSNVTEAIEPADSVYSVPIEDKYMSKGTLYVGFEAYDDTGYAERYEPVKVYIDSFINLGEGSSDNVYVVTVGVDSTETLAPGEQAYVENVGTKKDVRLKFGIPQGIKGDTGTLEIGDVVTLAPGEQAYVENLGTKSEAVLKIGIPEGRKGDKGDNGADGHTPQRGVDYWTPEDKAEIHGYIDQQLGVIENGSY